MPYRSTIPYERPGRAEYVYGFSLLGWKFSVPKVNLANLDIRKRLSNLSKAILTGANVGTSGTPIGLVTTLVFSNLGWLNKVEQKVPTITKVYERLERLTHWKIPRTHLNLNAIYQNVEDNVVSVIDRLFPESIFGVNALDTGMRVVGSPFLEVMTFQGVIQDLALTRLPKLFFGEKIVDSRIAKVARVVFTGALFGLYQFSTLQHYPPLFRSAFMVYAFGAGMVLATLKESEAGLVGATAAYMTHNLLKHSVISLVGAQLNTRALLASLSK